PSISGFPAHDSGPDPHAACLVRQVQFPGYDGKDLEKNSHLWPGADVLLHRASFPDSSAGGHNCMAVPSARKQLRPADGLLLLAGRGIAPLSALSMVCRLETPPQGLVAELPLKKCHLCLQSRKHLMIMI